MGSQNFLPLKTAIVRRKIERLPTFFTIIPCDYFSLVMDTSGKVFVTGGSGFIGARLVESLTDGGYSVRALTRRPTEPLPGFDDSKCSPLDHPNVEQVKGDVTDIESLRRGVDGCRYIFHLAGYAKNWARNPQTYDDINVGGLKNMLDVARDAAVERIVWTSTVVTFGPTEPDEVGDETRRRDPATCLTEYEASKYRAEIEAARHIDEYDTPLVIVNPTRVYGRGHLTEGNSLGRLINDYDRGRMPFLPNRGINIGNYGLVDDMVAGMIAAMQRGRIGEKYILGGENVTLRDFFEIIDSLRGRPRMKIPLPSDKIPLAFSWMLKKSADWFHIYPVITPGWIRTFCTNWNYSVAKAENELGYHPTPLRTGLEETYNWILRVRSEKKKRKGKG